MEGYYDVRLGKQSVGQVVVKKVGLYYEFDCRCTLSGEILFRLAVTCGGKTEVLGILVPQNGAFVLKTRVPAKRLMPGSPAFQLVPRHSDLPEDFVPLRPEEPFRYLTRLQDAFLIKTAQGPGIAFREEGQ